MFVSRQTISNWENDKSYPDIHNLLIMCQLFKVSLDELVEDDLKTCKSKILKRIRLLDMDDDNYNGIRKCSHRSYDSLLSLVRNRNNIFSIFNRYHCFYKIRKIKIKNDIETYDRILAFINGKDPKEVQKVSLEIYGHPQFLLFSLLV